MHPHAFLVPRWMFLAAIALIAATAAAVSLFLEIPTQSELDATKSDLNRLQEAVRGYASCVSENFGEVRLRVALGSVSDAADRLDKEKSRFSLAVQLSKQRPQAAREPNVIDIQKCEARLSALLRN